MTSTMNEMCRSGRHVLAESGLDSRGGCRACSRSARLSRAETRAGRMRRLLDDVGAPRVGWQIDARCGGEDPTSFLPVDGRGHSSDEIAVENAERHAVAKRICAICPVKPDCLGFVLRGYLRTGQKQYGTWAGEFFDEADWTAAATVKKEMARE